VSHTCGVSLRKWICDTTGTALCSREEGRARACLLACVACSALSAAAAAALPAPAATGNAEQMCHTRPQSKSAPKGGDDVAVGIRA